VGAIVVAETHRPAGRASAREPVALWYPYGFGRRFRPPRGTTYMSTMRATITTAAMATMATVEAATITRSSLSYGLLAKTPGCPRCLPPPSPVARGCPLRLDVGGLAQGSRGVLIHSRGEGAPFRFPLRLGTVARGGEVAFEGGWKQ
jgi:hypothetical protein